MDAARRHYLDVSAGTVRAFEEIAAGLAQRPDDRELLESLRRELHRVHGTAGTIGFMEAGRLAGAMSSTARRWEGDPAVDRDRRSETIMAFARLLREALTDDTTEANGETKRLLLMDLPADIAAPLVAAAVRRGIAAERISADELAQAVAAPNTWGVVARGMSAGSAPAIGLPRVLLREVAATTETLPPRTHVLDKHTVADDVLDVLEHAAARDTAAGDTLLAVDDDPVVRLLLERLGEREGLKIETVSDGAAFAEACAKFEPSMMIVDVELGTANGLDLVRTLRGGPRGADIPVLVLSGHNDESTRAAAFAAGADDFMAKPLVPEEFQQRVRRALESRRRSRISTGLHPSTGIALSVRALPALQERVASFKAGAACVVLVRPAVTPETSDGVVAWERECARIVRAVTLEGGDAGFADEIALALVLPGPAAEVQETLAALAGKAPADSPAWHAGVVATREQAALGALLDLAGEAVIAARDSSAPVRVWDPGDADISPDVIVIEDDVALADVISFALTARGLSHRLYHTGPDGLHALLRLKTGGRSPVVLLDIDLPGLDGHSLHEQLKRARPGVFRVVFMSGHAGEADQLRALQNGALDYLVKPVSLRILMAKLAVWRAQAPAA